MTAQQSVLASVRKTATNPAAVPVTTPNPATEVPSLTTPAFVTPQGTVAVTLIQPTWPTTGPTFTTTSTASSSPTDALPPAGFPMAVVDEISKNVTGLLGVKAHQKEIEDAPTEELNTAMVEEDLGLSASPTRSDKAISGGGSPQQHSPKSRAGQISDTELDEAVPQAPAAASAVQQTIKITCMEFERIYDKVRLLASHETSQYLDDMWRKLMFIRHESNLNNLSQDQQLLFTRAKRVVNIGHSPSLLVDLDQLVEDWKSADIELEAAKKKVPVAIDVVKKLLSLLPRVYPNSADLATWERLSNLLKNCSIYSSYTVEQEAALAEARQIYTAEKIRLESLGHTVNDVNLLLEAQLSLNQQQAAKTSKGNQPKKGQKKPTRGTSASRQPGVTADDYAYHNVAEGISSTPSKGRKRGAPTKQEKQASKKKRSEAAAAALNEDERLGFASSDEETPEQREEIKLRKKAIHASSDPAMKALYAAQLASDTMQRAAVKKLKYATRANNSLLKGLQQSVNDLVVTCTLLAERHQETESNSAIRKELGMGLMGWKTIYPIRDVFSNPNKILLLEKYVMRNVTNEGGTYACNLNDELFDDENRWRFFYRDPKSFDHHEEPRYQLGVECWVLPEAFRRFLRDCVHAYSLKQDARASKGIVNHLDPRIEKPETVIKSWVTNFRNHRTSNNFRKEKIDFYKQMWWYHEDPLMQQYGEICYLDGKESLYVTWKTPVPDTSNLEEVRLYVAENLKDTRTAYGGRLNERRKQQETMRKEANYKMAMDQEELAEQWAEEVVRSPLGVANFERHQVLTKAAAKAISRGQDATAILEKLRQDRPETYPRPDDDPDNPDYPEAAGGGNN